MNSADSDQRRFRPLPEEAVIKHGTEAADEQQAW